MRNVISASGILFLAIIATSFQSFAADQSIVFPPDDCSSAAPGLMSWRIGDTATRCKTGQDVLKLAIPGCTEGQLVVKRGHDFVCETPPTCPTNFFLNYADFHFICAPVALPKCTSGEFLTSTDGLSFACATVKTCKPNWTTTGVGTCSEPCDGGTQDVYQSDGCGNTRTESQACNTQACPAVCAPNWTTTGLGSCSVSCGGGTQAVHQSDGCGNTRTTSQSCNAQACGPVAVGGGDCTPYTCSETGYYGCGSPPGTAKCPYTWSFWGVARPGNNTTGSGCPAGTQSTFTRNGTSFTCWK